MAKATGRRVIGHDRFIGTGVAALVMVLGLIPAAALGRQEKEKPTYAITDFGVVPRPSVIEVLLAAEAVQDELKLTDAQKREYRAASARQEREMRQKLQKARRDNKEPEKRRAAVAAVAAEARTAIRRIFEPEQWERLDQIQLQAQGSYAFSRSGDDGAEWSGAAFVGPPLADRLKLSDDQARRIREIADEGDGEIGKAASFPIVLEPKSKPPSKEEIYKLLDSPEFRAAKKTARQAGRDAGAAVIRRIEAVLTEPQRRAYHELLGKPFDLSRLERGLWGQQERMRDIRMVTRLLGGGGGGQGADLGFNTKVARPAYAGGSKHPRVLFDEAHHNYHTAGGLYKPFADLITSDGYQVIPNGETFTRDALRKGDILVIANALGAASMGSPEASHPAFTDAECDAVQEWVREGGSLLLITDHAPMGAAAAGLASRFGVDMRKGHVGDPENSEGGESSLIFSRQNKLLGDHAITRGRDESERLNKVRTFTGTSLKGPAGSVPILKLADTAVDHSPDDGEDAPAAGRAQGLALSFGKGRVVVMGEAAELSAQGSAASPFGMNAPGIDNRQMALNIVHWLSGLLEPREGALKKAG